MAEIPDLHRKLQSCTIRHVISPVQGNSYRTPGVHRAGNGFIFSVLRSDQHHTSELNNPGFCPGYEMSFTLLLAHASHRCRKC